MTTYSALATKATNKHWMFSQSLIFATATNTHLCTANTQPK